MAMLVSYWERRDHTDRDAFGRAALSMCRATRARDGVRSSRFYWVTLDTVVLQSELESFDVLSGGPSAEQSAAVYVLSDLARPVRQERWEDAGRGEETYRRVQQAALSQ